MKTLWRKSLYFLVRSLTGEFIFAFNRKLSLTINPTSKLSDMGRGYRNKIREGVKNNNFFEHFLLCS